jgi:DNA invertase Pin-like site-specific DNA recombinase
MRNKKNHRCAIYTRSATGDTASLQAQEIRCRTAVQQAGWTVVDIRSDSMASGNSLCLSKREGLASLIVGILKKLFTKSGL